MSAVSDLAAAEAHCQAIEQIPAEERSALEDIVRGDYADGAERAHPAVARAKRALSLSANTKAEPRGQRE